MILADEYSSHPPAPSVGSYEFYAYAGVTYVMFSDGVPRPLSNQSDLIFEAKTASFSVTNQNLLLTSGSGLITATLPTAVGYKREITFKHIGSQDLTIIGVSGQTIDGNTDVQLRANKKQSITIFSDGANWWIK